MIRTNQWVAEPRRRAWPRVASAIALVAALSVFASFSNGVGAEPGRLSQFDRPIPAGFVPTLSVVEPTGGAVYGEKVIVRWTGMAPGTAFLQQCPTPERAQAFNGATFSSCDSGSTVVANTAADGTGSAEFVLFPKVFFVGQADRFQQNCQGGDFCEIRVSSCSLDYGDNVAAHVIAPQARPGALVDEDGDMVPARPPTYVPPAPPAVTNYKAPPPRPTNRATVFGAGGTGAGLALEALSAQSLASDNGVDVSYAARTVDNGYEAMMEDKNDFAVAGFPLLPNSFFSTPPGATPSDAAALAEKRALAATTNANLVYVPVAAGSLDAVYDINVVGLQQNELRVSQDALAVMVGTKSGVRLGTGAQAVDNFTILGNTGWDSAQRCRIPAKTLSSLGDPQSSFTAITYAGRSEVSSTNWKVSEFIRATRPALTDRPANDPDFFKSALAKRDKAERTGSNALALSMVDLSLDPLSPDSLSVQWQRRSGRIGLIDHAYSLKYSNRLGSIQNPSGAYVLPSQAGVTATLKQATIDRTKGLVNVGFGGTDPSAYPLTMLYYVAVPKTLTASLTAENAKDLNEFLTYAVSPAGQAAVGSIGYTPLTTELTAFATEQIAKIGQAVPETTTTTAPDATTDAADPGSTVPASTGGGSSGGGSSGGLGGSGSRGSSGGFGGSSVDGAGGDAPTLSPETAAPAVDPNVTVTGEDSGPLAAIARVAGDLLGMPGISPGLVLLGLIGSVACIAGPVMGRVRGRRRAS